MASAIGGFIDDLKRERDDWKDSCARYHAANADLLKERNDMLDLLRRIARKGEFMDREGLRLVVSDWLARCGLSLENIVLPPPASPDNNILDPTTPLPHSPPIR